MTCVFLTARLPCTAVTTGISQSISTDSLVAIEPRTNWQWAGAGVAAGVAYFLAGLLGLTLAEAGGNVSPVWPPTAVAIALLWRCGVGLWPAIAAGALLVNFSTGLPWWTASIIAVGNTLEPVVAVILLNKFGARRAIDRPIDVLAYLGLACGIGPAISALGGVIALQAANIIPDESWPSVFQTWWLGNMTGALIFGPILILARNPANWLPRGQIGEVLAMIASIAAISIYLFVFKHRPGTTPSLVSYVVLPLLMWPAFRFNQTAVSLAIAIMGAFGLVGLVVNGIPNNLSEIFMVVLQFQGFLVLAAVTGLLIGALIHQRRESDAQLLIANHAVQNAADMVLWLNQNGQVIYANRSAHDKLQAGEHENLVGAQFDDLCPEFDHLAWQQLWAALADGSETLDLGMLQKEGKMLPVELKVSLFQDKHQKYACAIIRDLSERHLLEAELFQAQKLDALGRLAGGIAHDFNNMLAAIRGNAELAQLDKNLHDGARDRLDNIIGTCDHAANLTSQILVFSRGNMAQAQPVDIGEVTNQAINLAQRTLGERIAITSKVPAELPTVRADPSRLQQALLNILVNARDAMDDGGTISVTVVGNAEHVQVVIRDDGPGIPPEIRDYIFEPFFTTKGPGQGTGLGLSIVHAAITQMQGTIHVESPPEGGAVFTVVLPTAARSSNTSRFDLSRDKKPLVPHAFGHDRLVLLAEDQDDVRELTKQLLTRLGFEVLAAEDGAAALDLITSSDRVPELIVSDMVMPHLGGIELVRSVHHLHGMIPTVFLSGYTSDDLDTDLPPRSTFLVKPFSLEDLSTTVQALLAVSTTMHRSQRS